MVSPVIEGAAPTSEAFGIPDQPQAPDAANGPITLELPDASDIQLRPEAQAMQVAASPLCRVIARHGLLVRGGPGTEFPGLHTLPYGTQLNVLKREGQWALIDVQGDSAADGFVLSSFLDNTVSTLPLTTVDASSDGDRFIVIKPPLLQLVMDRCANAKVKSKLKLNVVADALTRSMIKANATTRKREVAFLSQAVIETDFFKTFREYQDGPNTRYYPYYGRGIHQLTWRDTYAACSRALFSDDLLVRTPDLILKDIEVNIAATAWFWRDYKPFNRLADAGDVDGIIYRLYGGKITNPDPKVKKSVLLRRSYYKIIDGLLDQHSA